MFKKRYWLIFVIYIAMQALTVIIPLAAAKLFGITTLSLTIYNMIALFVIAALLSLWVLREDIREERIKAPMSAGRIIGWTALGLLLVWVSEMITGSIVMYGLGIEQDPANAEPINLLADLNPLFLLVPAVVGPILEELIFRKIIFGYFNQRFNFWVGAIVSSILFGAIHMDLAFVIVYAGIGFVLAAIYAHTKRIIVPILIHMSVNTFAVLIPMFVDLEKLEEMQEQLSFIQFLHF